MADLNVRIRKIHDVFLVDAGNVHFSATIEEMQQLKNALQVAITKTEEARHG